MSSIHVRVDECLNDVTSVEEAKMILIMRISLGQGNEILVKLLDGELHYTRCVVSMIYQFEHFYLRNLRLPQM